LLEHLPEIPQQHHAETAANFLEKYGKDFDEQERQKMVEKVVNITCNSSFANIFSQNSKAEVPIEGTIGNSHISGQIDRLVIEDNRVLVVDYKTNKNPPKSVEQIPQAYLDQISSYRALLTQIFPDKKIECAFIWTEVPELTVPKVLSQSHVSSSC